MQTINPRSRHRRARKNGETTTLKAWVRKQDRDVQQAFDEGKRNASKKPLPHYKPMRQSPIKTESKKKKGDGKKGRKGQATE